MQENEIEISQDLESKFIEICIDGDINQVQAMLRQAENRQELLSARAFRKACLHNRIEVVKYLLRATESSEEMLSVYDYEGFENACAEGYIELAQYLFETYPAQAQQMIQGSRNRAFYWACSGNQIAVAKWLFKVAEDKQSLISSSYEPSEYAVYEYAAFMVACENGHKDLAAWLLSVSDNPQNLIRAKGGFSFKPYNAFLSACRNKHYEIVKLLMGSSNSEDIQAMIDFASYNGEVKEVLEKFRSEIPRVRLNSHIINQGLRTDSSLSASPHCFFSTMATVAAIEVVALSAVNPPLSYDEAKKIASKIIVPGELEKGSKEAEKIDDSYSWIKNLS